jgi:hypothetical protein
MNKFYISFRFYAEIPKISVNPINGGFSILSLIISLFVFCTQLSESERTT